MFTIRIRFFLVAMLCSMALFAQDSVPDVRLKSHPLSDLYIYTSGQLGIPNEIQSLTSINKKMMGSGFKFGLGYGFHWPNSTKIFHTIRMGYYYRNDTYKECDYTKGLITHWMNADLRGQVSISGGLSFILWGIESNVLLGNFDSKNVSWEYLGMSGECYNRATLGVYFGFSFQVVNDFYVEYKAIGYNIISPFNEKRTFVYMLDPHSSLTDFYFELSFTYRIFTTGKKDQEYDL